MSHVEVLRQMMPMLLCVYANAEEVEQARAALTAAIAALEGQELEGQEGVVMVPRVPTEAMIDCALRFLPNVPRVCMAVAIEDAIECAAAPAQPAGGGDVNTLLNALDWIADANMDKPHNVGYSDKRGVEALQHKARMAAGHYRSALPAAPAQPDGVSK